MLSAVPADAVSQSIILGSKLVDWDIKSLNTSPKNEPKLRRNVGMIWKKLIEMRLHALRKKLH